MHLSDFQERCRQVALEEFLEMYSRLLHATDSPLKRQQVESVLEEMRKEFSLEVLTASSSNRTIDNVQKLYQELHLFLN
ncbi:hypothetical protein ACV3PA_16485 (plasmid) [Exiguobacterium acetylicum]